MNQELLVRIEESGADGERLDALATTLRDELLQLDVDDVRRPSEGEAPAGTRGLEIAAIGALLVSFKATAEVVSGVVGTIRGWLARGSAGRSVEITIGDRKLVLESASPEQQERVITEFLRVAAED